MMNVQVKAIKYSIYEDEKIKQKTKKSAWN